MWVRLDDKLHSHPKVAGLELQALGVHVLALSYCGDYLTDGHVPRGIALRYCDTPERMDELVAAGLWEAVEDGWVIHDFLVYNPSREEVLAARDELSEKRAEAGRRGAAARWHGKRDGKPHGKPGAS